MSVLLRMLAWIGEGDAGGVRSAGWVRTVEDGARTLAVATGKFTPDALKPFGADYVLPDLSDFDAVSRLIQPTES